MDQSSSLTTVLEDDIDIGQQTLLSTLPETNIAPENRPSQKESSLPTIHFQGRTLSFREGNSKPQHGLCGHSVQAVQIAGPSWSHVSSQVGF